jgi:BirA family transcriptional regulator, biotin operon repressor / biotin---[acetyl-CoA-carboxylase] ligase
MTDDLAMTGDLGAEQVSAALGDRPARAYPAVLSTEPVAMAWARSGAPSGAVVVAEYQASPRGRAGLPWTVRLGRGLGFTLVHRDADLPLDREGWPYAAALLGLHDVVGTSDSCLAWPDAVCAADGRPLARLGVHVEPGPGRTDWVSITVLVEDAAPPRGTLLRQSVEAVENRLAAPPTAVLDDYRPRCSTLGRTVRARMLPLGPAGPEVVGEAVDVLADGALVLVTARGNRVAVPPHDLGLLDEPQGPVQPPERLLGHLPPP